MKDFKIRCSSIHRIMAGRVGLTDRQAEQLAELQAKAKRTDKQHATMLELQAKAAAKELPQSAKTYVEEWFVQSRYGIKFEFESKYTRKGNEMEATALQRYAGEFADRNDEYFEDDHLTGTPDFIIPDTLVADIKCPYGPQSFPFFEPEPPAEYWAQLQGYMALTGLKRAELVFCLEDTPPRGDWEDWTRYDMIPDTERIRVYHFDYDPTFIASVRERVGLCRDYVNELEERFLK